VVGAEPAEFVLAGVGLAVEFVNQAQAGGDVAGPRLGSWSGAISP
jgi:hypothetical protein